MSRVQVVRRRLDGLVGLADAVSAMQSLAASHLREARRALPLAETYREGLLRSLADAGVALPGGRAGPPALVVVGSELGLCGGYNGRVATLAEARRRERGPGPVLAVGRRMARALARRGLEPAASFAAPTSLAGVPGVVLALAEHALGRFLGGELGEVDLVSATFAGVGRDEPTVTPLLPLRVPPAAGVPLVLRYSDRATLARQASLELLYVTIYARMVEALASEHGARLVATRAAGDWLDGRIRRMRRNLLTLRQEAGTQEALEVASAGRAAVRGRTPT